MGNLKEEIMKEKVKSIKKNLVSLSLVLLFVLSIVSCANQKYLSSQSGERVISSLDFASDNNESNYDSVFLSSYRSDI